MRRILAPLALLASLVAVDSRAECGIEEKPDYTMKWCQQAVLWAGVGVAANVVFPDDAVYIHLDGVNDNGWFWTTSANKNAVLATALSAKAQGTPVQIRYVDEPRGKVAAKRILSILAMP